MGSSDKDKSGYSRENLLGDVTHYDKNGKKIGESRPSIWGGYDDFDASGKRVGESRPNMLGGYTTYRDGKKVSETYQSFTGWDTYDKDGVHHSGQAIPGAYHHDRASGIPMPSSDDPVQTKKVHVQEPRVVLQAQNDNAPTFLQILPVLIVCAIIIFIAWTY